MSWQNDQVSDSETNTILALAKKSLEIEGDFVEFGCYKGDTSLLLADLIKNTDKTLWLYDSFEGLPPKSANDTSALGQDFKPGALATTKRELKQRFLRANLKLPIIKKAWFNELTRSDIPDKISFAFLDGDFYESIKTSLELITPHLSPGATIVIHDYTNPALPGVAKAVNEWLSKKPSVKTTQKSTIVIIQTI
ncbi:class I SAM-dependent methyltransferase [Candidatus Saccharibacteria bacterium]|nr:class I SAM-dependent methyltransferase [Candidatus Saccharibacteria bacterium]